MSWALGLILMAVLPLVQAAVCCLGPSGGLLEVGLLVVKALRVVSCYLKECMCTCLYVFFARLRFCSPLKPRPGLSVGLENALVVTEVRACLHTLGVVLSKWWRSCGKGLPVLVLGLGGALWCARLGKG